MYLYPATNCFSGSEVFVAPTVFQVESRNWNRPYAVELGFCARGLRLDSCWSSVHSAGDFDHGAGTPACEVARSAAPCRAARPVAPAWGACVGAVPPALPAPPGAGRAELPPAGFGSKESFDPGKFTFSPGWMRFGFFWN